MTLYVYRLKVIHSGYDYTQLLGRLKRQHMGHHIDIIFFFGMYLKELPGVLPSIRMTSQHELD